jgi:hypothetical protein
LGEAPKTDTSKEPKRDHRDEDTPQPDGDLFDVLSRARAMNDGNRHLDNDILRSF